MNRKCQGADMQWLPWMRGYGRCPYCTGLPLEDWWAVCDCWMAENWQTPPPYPPMPDLGDVIDVERLL